jgi:hypothetical protein
MACDLKWSPLQPATCQTFVPPFKRAPNSALGRGHMAPHAPNTSDFGGPKPANGVTFWHHSWECTQVLDLGTGNTQKPG